LEKFGEIGAAGAVVFPATEAIPHAPLEAARQCDNENNDMRRLLTALLFFVAAACAANFRLYLKDGSYQLINQYKVEGDRVRYYTVERSDWEEIPAELVDLPRTEKEASVRKQELDHDAKALAEEDAAERALVKEAMRIPQEPGVYWLDGNQAKPIKLAPAVLHTDKRREVLKRLSPIPAVSGKAALEIDGAHSPNVFKNPEQELYLELTDRERFGIIRLTTKGNVRIVETVFTQPVTNELDEQQDVVETFNQQLDDNGSGLYKIWPKDRFTPGEYAVVEFTQGKLLALIWDFAIQSPK
jgi:hypothetical protein